MKKRIIISSYDDLKNPYYAGGGAYAVHEIGKTLLQDFDVTILTANYKGAKEERIDGIAYKRIGPRFLGPKIGQLVYQILLLYYAKRESYSIWVENFTPPFSTSFLPLITNKPIIGLVQMLAGEDMERKYKIPVRWIENLGIAQYKHFIVLTKETYMKIYKKNRKAHIFIIPVGIEEAPKTLKQKENDSILYLGRIEFDQKGLDLLLDAFSMVEIKNAHLIIAGSGNRQDEELLRSHIQLKRLSKKVTLMGRVSRKKKINLLSQASVVVTPSRFETFGLTALEACSFGKPVVGFDIEGFKWIPGNVMVKVPPFDTQALSNTLTSLIRDKNIRVPFREIGRRFAVNYTWDVIGKKYIKAINQILQISI